MNRFLSISQSRKQRSYLGLFIRPLHRLAALSDPLPFLLVSLLINFISRQLRQLLVLALFRQNEIEKERQESCNRKARLQDQLNGIEESE